MKQILIFCAAALLLGGCTKDISEAELPGKVRVQVRIQPDQPEAVSVEALSATKENAIADVNLYLIDRIGYGYLHFYATSPYMLFECLPGRYDMYVAANLHQDLGHQTAEQMQELQVRVEDDYADLPMTAVVQVSIQAGPTLFELPPVRVTRRVARVDYRIEVAEEVADIRLSAYQLCNLPARVRLFGPHAPSLDARDYRHGGIVEVAAAQAASCSGTEYIAENLQGVVSTIHTQDQKDRVHAPKYATYLLIRAHRGDKVLTYRVYMGENNTTDFNLRANTQYTLGITIRGDNTVDTRIEQYTLTVWDDFGSASYGGYCVQEPVRQLHVRVQDGKKSLSLSGRLEITAGYAERFCFDGGKPGREHAFDILKSGTYSYECEYDPTLITEDRARLAFTVTLTDQWGFARSYDFEHRFANLVNALVAGGKGTVSAAGALHTEPCRNDGSRIVLCYEECTLTATPDAGYGFAGWYADPRCSQLLTTTPSYRFRPASCHSSLYAKFDVAVQRLDSEGTANCYIAPAHGTRYAFNARVKGNNRRTTGIIPTALSGTTARVLWESGTTRGAVVREAEYRDGTMYLTTGNTYGNAMIGLFDQSDECVWSWHIWVCNYDPDATAQTCRSGAVFMDRNLGALATIPTAPATRGLYYQWGRKDPFMHPATVSSPERAATVYADGFGYDTTDPTYGYGEMTLSYAIGHPWCFMCGYFMGDDRYQDIPDWLKLYNPNLWGNASSETYLSDAGAKSIYDPCPPGWKVPSRTAFTEAQLSVSTASAKNGYYLSSGNSTSFYPMGGFLDASFRDNGSACYLWTDAPAQDQNVYYYKHESTALRVSSAGVEPLFRVPRCYGLPVRCVKEE